MCIVLSYGQAHRLVMLFISSCASGKVNHNMLEQDRADLTQEWTFPAKNPDHVQSPLKSNIACTHQEMRTRLVQANSSFQMTQRLYQVGSIIISHVSYRCTSFPVFFLFCHVALY